MREKNVADGDEAKAWNRTTRFSTRCEENCHLLIQWPVLGTAARRDLHSPSLILLHHELYFFNMWTPLTEMEAKLLKVNPYINQ